MTDNPPLLTQDEQQATAYSYCFTCKAHPGTYCTVATTKGRIRLLDHPTAPGGAHKIRVTTWRFQNDEHPARR
jgi:hypothetical protein